MDQIPVLVFQAHQTALRTLCDHGDAHCEGLSVAARTLRRQKKLSAKWCKKLVALDSCFAVVRHITCASVKSFQAELLGDLQKQRDTGAQEVKPTFRQGVASSLTDISAGEATTVVFADSVEGPDVHMTDEGDAAKDESLEPISPRITPATVHPSAQDGNTVPHVDADVLAAESALMLKRIGQALDYLGARGNEFQKELLPFREELSKRIGVLFDLHNRSDAPHDTRVKAIFAVLQWTCNHPQLHSSLAAAELIDDEDTRVATQDAKSVCQEMERIQLRCQHGGGFKRTTAGTLASQPKHALRQLPGFGKGPHRTRKRTK
mmetsp:Transcript_44677/g.81538  ORF Transcript_44677/g.81538 Transcript_44677/m.81538 type:complete len:320 (+) Transcript_44677:96-1055(+)